jgi:NADH-quinone oxidoreductase subunit A
MTTLTSLVGYLVLFVGVGVLFLFGTLLVGKLIRPDEPDPEKVAIYECGEPTIGSSWIQFDLRFYVVALLFVIFDVEVAFFFPWAAVFGRATQLADPTTPAAKQLALTADLASASPASTTVLSRGDARTLAIIAVIDLLVFFGVLLVGFAYLWKRGDLDWVRATTEPVAEPAESRTEPELAETAA